MPAFFRLTGLVQYFLKMPSHNHCMRDRWREAARMALSTTDWYCLSETSSACFSEEVGRGLVAINLVGRISSTVEAGVDALRVGVATWTILARFSGLLSVLFSYFFLGLGSLLLTAGVAAVLRTLLAGVVGLIVGGGGLLANLLAADSLRCRAGSTRFAGVASVILTEVTSSYCGCNYHHPSLRLLSSK